MTNILPAPRRLSAVNQNFTKLEIYISLLPPAQNNNRRFSVVLDQESGLSAEESGELLRAALANTERLIRISNDILDLFDGLQTLERIKATHPGV